MFKEREAVIRYLRNLAAQARRSQKLAKTEVTRAAAAEREKAYKTAVRLIERMR